MSAGAWTLRAATAAVALLLAYEIVTISVAARALAGGRSGAAVSLRPNFALAAENAAHEALSSGDTARAALLAADAVRGSPLDQAATSELALARETQHRLGEEAGMMKAAGELGWRDPAVQLWTIKAALIENAPDVAVTRADAMLRQGTEPDRMLRLMRVLSRSPGGFSTLVERLSERPNWRPAYLDSLAGLTPADYPVHAHLLLALKHGEGPPSREEIGVFVGRLVSEQRYVEARRLWTQLTGGADPNNLIGDPKFASLLAAEPSPSPFEWTNYSAPDVEIGSAPSSGDRRGAVLSIAISGSGARRVIGQTLVLAPGQYVLRFGWHKDASDGSLKWAVSCTGGAEVPLTPESGRGSAPEAAKVWTLSVPAGCPSQQLVLWADKSTPDRAEFQLGSPTLEANR